jgi:chromosomal replication initiation ATPase DnaA
LLHLINLLRERRGFLLLTARRAPARWRAVLPDLRSRLSAVPAAELAAPDDVLIEGVLVKLFADRQLRVAPEVVRFLAARIERSFAAARAAVAALDETALAGRREITVPLARELLRRRGETFDSER